MPNEIVSIFTDTGVRVAKEMAAEGCCIITMPSALMSVREMQKALKKAFPRGKLGITHDEHGRSVKMVVGLDKHNLDVFRFRVRTYDNIEELNDAERNSRKA